MSGTRPMARPAAWTLAWMLLMSFGGAQGLALAEVPAAPPAGTLMPVSPAASTAAAAATSTPSRMQLAVRFDHGRSVMSLLLAGADPNEKDAQRNSLLHLAVREESGQALEALLKSPAIDVNAINQAGETPVMLAALKGRLDWVKTLVQRGALINEAGWTALHYAASGTQEEVVRWLVKQGADLNARSPNGTTPLMMAAGYGGLSGAEVLIDAGADVALRNDQRLSAADFARRAGQDELADRLERLVRQAAAGAQAPSSAPARSPAR